MSNKTRPQKFEPTLPLKWYPQDLIGRAKLFDISAANQNQGGKCIFNPGISSLARKRRVLQRAVCHLAACIDDDNNNNNNNNNNNKLKETTCLQHCKKKLIKKRYKIGIVDSPLCTFCQISEESLEHLFIHCPISSAFWLSVAE